MSKKTCHHCYKKFEEEDMIGSDECFSCAKCHKRAKQQQQEKQGKCSLINACFPYFLVSAICFTIILFVYGYKKSGKGYYKKLFEKDKE